MNKLVKVLSILPFTTCLMISAVNVPAAHAEDLDAMIARLQARVADLNKIQKETGENISAVENEYKQELEEHKKANPGYDEKIAEAKEKRKGEKIDVSSQEEVDLFAAEEKTVDKKSTSVTTTKTEDAKSPFKRNPSYVAPKATSKGRRPFKRSDNHLSSSKLFFATVYNSEIFSFAKEDDSQPYTGTTEENVFVFSDNLANYCSIDTTSLDKMQDCLNQLMKEKSGSSQAVVDKVTGLISESLQDTTVNAVSEAARYKNDSAGYETNVLTPLQEKSSNATTERDDIEVLTLNDMEISKLLNKLNTIKANQLGLDAFRSFGTFEINSRDMTDINEEYNAEVESGS